MEPCDFFLKIQFNNVEIDTRKRKKWRIIRENLVNISDTRKSDQKTRKFYRFFLAVEYPSYITTICATRPSRGYRKYPIIMIKKRVQFL